MTAAPISDAAFTSSERTSLADMSSGILTAATTDAVFDSRRMYFPGLLGSVSQPPGYTFIDARTTTYCNKLNFKPYPQSLVGSSVVVLSWVVSQEFFTFL